MESTYNRPTLNDFDDDLRSLPCSAEEAKHGLPVMVQLHLVDSGLEENPHPREDFYRQYSVTPERQTPEAERTPPPPPYCPEIHLQKNKDWAMRVAKSLKQFHAGRAMLRKEEAEEEGDGEKDIKYWKSKIDQWQDFAWGLFKEAGRRKKMELKGEAEEGYARAMLLSPLSSPSLPPADLRLPEAIQHAKPTTTMSEKSPTADTLPLQPHATLSQLSLRPAPGPLPADPLAPPKGTKRTRAEVEENEKEESLDQSSRTQKKTVQQILEQQHALKRTLALRNATLSLCPAPGPLRANPLVLPKGTKRTRADVENDEEEESLDQSSRAKKRPRREQKTVEQMLEFQYARKRTLALYNATHPLHPAPGPLPVNPLVLPKGTKRTRADVEQGKGEESLDQSSRTKKKPRREQKTVEQMLELQRALKSTLYPRPKNRQENIGSIEATELANSKSLLIKAWYGFSSWETEGTEAALPPCAKGMLERIGSIEPKEFAKNKSLFLNNWLGNLRPGHGLSS